MSQNRPRDGATMKTLPLKSKGEKFVPCNRYILNQMITFSIIKNYVFTTSAFWPLTYSPIIKK